jgi:hypothetical protein
VSARLRRFAAVAVLTVLVATTAGCATTLNIKTGDPDLLAVQMRCDQPPGIVSGMHVLLAQSVPTATALPCITHRLDTWTLSRFVPRTGNALVAYEYHLGGDEEVTIELAPTCDVRGLREISSEHPGSQRYDVNRQVGGLYADERHYVFPGSCTSIKFHLNGTGADLRGAEVAVALKFITRESIDRKIREVSRGRLQLDPPGA